MSPVSVRRVVLGLVAVLVITGLSLLLSPIGRRWLADPGGATPQIGVTEVRVVARAGQNHAFEPSVIQVPAGTTVTWQFEDVDDGEPVPHNVVGEGFASDILSEGTYSHTFDEPGSYPYTCTLHAFMDGRVEVVAP